MTGISIEKERVIVSSRLLAPQGCCGRSVDERAVAFKKTIVKSLRSDRLQAEIATKALTDAFPQIKTKAYEDTDNRKREFSADARPGVKELAPGHRVELAGQWSPNKELILFPSQISQDSISTLPNMGWLDKNPKLTFEQLITREKAKPSIQLTVYDVDKKTGAVKEESARKIDPLAPASGMTSEERHKALMKFKEMQPDYKEKRLPGRSLSSIVPGGSLIARFAGRFGVLMDERNKFRCPPGTPAANQFTDMFGSNCFGFSASRFARYAARKAQELFPDGQDDPGGFRNTARSFFQFLKDGTWDVRPLEIDWAAYPELANDVIALEDMERARIGRTISYDAATGERVPSIDWTTLQLPENMRLFQHGMANAQRELAARDARIASLQQFLGVDTSEAARATNEDTMQTFELLRQKNLWDISIDRDRLNPQQVRELTEARLEAIPSWQQLSPKEKEAMIEADIKRYYESERGFLEAVIDQFVQNPSAARFLKVIEYNPNSNDEASTAFRGGRGDGPIHAVMSINMVNILRNQELMLPQMRENQRLGIAAVGAATDAQAQETVADFMVNANHAARRMAGLVDGARTFAAHIGIHEFSHVYQGVAYLNKALEQMDSPEGLELPGFNREGEFAGTRVVRKIEDLTGADIFSLMARMNDSIDLKDMNDALSKLENVRMLAGRYPSEITGKGQEVWGLEIAAEVWALREQGLIWGEDVDAALAFIDDVVGRPSAVARANTDVVAEADDAASTVDVPATPSTGPMVPVDQMDADQLDEYLQTLAADQEATLQAERDEIKEYIAGLNQLSENGMIDEAAVQAMSMDLIEESYLKPLREQEILDDPNVDPRLTELRRQHRDMLVQGWQRRSDISQRKYDEVRKAWRKKYGVGARGELDRFESRVQAARDRSGLWTPEQRRIAAQELALDELRDKAARLNQNELLDEIVRSTRLFPSIESGSTQALEIATGMEILKSEYVDRAIDGGDKRSRARIMRDLEEKIEEIISPKPKPPKKFKKAQDTKDFATAERAKHRRAISKEQAAAIREVGDFRTSSIAQILSPERQVQLGRAMNRVTARRRRNNLGVNDRRADQADFPAQVKNILLPVMEAIDRSSVSEGFEIETVMDIDPNETRGNAIGRVLDQPNFVSGVVTRAGSKPTQIPRAEAKNELTLKTRRRVIVRVREGDRGLFPNTPDDPEQQFVVPPSSYRIVGRSNDGALIVEIARQKDTVEVADDLVKSLTTGYSRGTAQIVDDKIWRDGAVKKIKPIVDQTILDMRTSGRVVGPASDDDDIINGNNAQINGGLADLDGYFGEGIMDDDQGFSSGATSSDALGPRETRSQRTRRRTKQIASDITEIRAVLGGKGSRKYPELSADAITPEVREMLLSLSTAELQTKLEEIGYRFHSGLDRRVRVRMREADLDELSRTGRVRSPLASGNAERPAGSRRAERLSRMTAPEREGRFSSGALPSVKEFEARQEREKQIAQDAVKLFDKIINAGVNIDDLSDGDLADLFNGRVTRSDRVSVSDRVPFVYKADNVQTALALMMAGHHVEVSDQDLTMTKQAQMQFEKVVRNGAAERINANHADWMRFKETFARENKQLDLNDEKVLAEAKRQYVEKFVADLCMLYNPEKNLLCSGHIGIEREKMPQLNGRTVGHQSLAIRMLTSGQAKGKWASQFKKLTKDLPKKDTGETDEAYVGRLRNQGVDENLVKAYEDSLRYDRLSSQHPSPKNPTGSISDEDKAWMYANTDWQDTEVNLEGEFMEFLESVLPQADGGKAVRQKEVVPSEYAPSQSQLVASKVDDTNETILKSVLSTVEEMTEEGWDRGTPAFREEFLKRIFENPKNWWTGAILTTSDGYILDGHHRWAGFVVANRSLDEELQIPIRVNEVQTDIIQGLTLGKAFQDSFGIKEARLGVENPWVQGDIDAVDPAEVVRVKQNVVDTVGERVDELYDRGDFIQLGSVGLKNNPDYAEAARQRRRLASERRKSPAAMRRQQELDDAIDLASRPESEQSFSSGRTTGLTTPQKIRQASAIVNAVMSRANVDKDTKESIKFALGLIDSLTDRKTARLAARDVAAEIAKRSGKEVARLALEELAARGRIPSSSVDEIMDGIEVAAPDRLPRQGSKLIQRAFAAAVDALKEISDEAEDLGERSTGSSRLSKVRRKLNRGRVSGEPSFSSGANSGLAMESLTREYFNRIGLPADMDDEMLPVSGYVVHKSHLDAKRKKVQANGVGNTMPNAVFEIGDDDEIGDGLTAMGEIEVVLKPQVSNRTAYSIGDPVSSGARPVRLNATNREDISDALVGATNANDPSANVQTMLNMLAADKSNDLSGINASFSDDMRMLKPGSSTMEASSRKPIEAMILGGFDANEVEQINYPYSKIQELAANERIDDVVNELSIAERLRNSGFTDEEIQYFYSVNRQGSLNTDAMRLLREYRAANRVKENMRSRGFNKVKIAHPSGINMDDPRSFAKTADAASSIEDVLKNRIMNEINEEAKKMLKVLRDGKSPTLIGTGGGRL